MKVRMGLILVLAAYASFTWCFLTSIYQVASEYDQQTRYLSQESPYPAAIVRFDGVKQGLVVPHWNILNTDREWTYVSGRSAIPLNYQPPLTDIAKLGGDWLMDKRLAPLAKTALDDLFQAASADGHQLIVTSAYRSADLQRQLMDDYTATYGGSWTAEHVAHPGQSEHQLGLAADLSSYSPSCYQNFGSCQLSLNTANWLKEQAPKFGFILRYPPEKISITGVAHEPWHFRYVGVPLATIAQQSGLTFDEISDQLQAAKQKGESR